MYLFSEKENIMCIYIYKSELNLIIKVEGPREGDQDLDLL